MIYDNLKELATTIGWVEVNEDKDYNVFEYNFKQNRYEKVTHIVKIYHSPTANELYEIIQVLKRVLPKKLRKRIDKVVHKFKLETIENLTELIKFDVEEFISKSEYAKLDEYANLLGTSLEALGYKYQYELTKSERAEILAKVENLLPIEKAPILGKMKKTDYKIAYIKNQKNKLQDKE